MDILAQLQQLQKKNVAKVRDPISLAVNSLVNPWAKFKPIYDFTPMRILPQLLYKIEKQRVPVIFIIPNWPKRT